MKQHLLVIIGGAFARKNSFLTRARNIDFFVMQILVEQIPHKIALKTQLKNWNWLHLSWCCLVGRKHNFFGRKNGEPNTVVVLRNWLEISKYQKTIQQKLSNGKKSFLYLWQNSTLLCSFFLQNVKTLCCSCNCRIQIWTRNHFKLVRPNANLVQQWFWTWETLKSPSN